MIEIQYYILFITQNYENYYPTNALLLIFFIYLNKLLLYYRNRNEENWLLYHPFYTSSKYGQISKSWRRE